MVWIDGRLDGWGRAAGVLTILALVLTPLWFLGYWLLEQGDLLKHEVWVDGLILHGEAILIFLAGWTAFLSHRWRLRRYRARYDHRLVGAKDWYARGLLDQQEFERFRRSLLDLGAGNFSGERLLLGSQLSTRVGAVALLLGISHWSVVALAEPVFTPEQGGILLFAGLLGAALLVGGAFLLLVGIAARATARAGVRSYLVALEEDELGILGAVRRRTEKPTIEKPSRRGRARA